jgi:hypothetical protein
MSRGEVDGGEISYVPVEAFREPNANVGKRST